MCADTLRDIRRRIERRATEMGHYRIACARTGDSPVPVTRLRFPSRDAACEAARDAQLYRARLCSLEPRLPQHDLIVHEEVSVADIDGSELVSKAFWAFIGSRNS